MGYFEQKWAYYSRLRAPDDASVPLNFTAAEDGSTVALNKVGSPSSISLEYSLDGQTWNTYNVGTEITLAHVGDKVFFKGNNSQFSKSSSNFYKFVVTGKVLSSGNVMSLIDASCSLISIPSDYMFFGLFYGAAGLLTAPLLPATTLKSSCYAFMFCGAVDLLSGVRSLPAKTLVGACYNQLYNGCVSLIEPSEMAANEVRGSVGGTVNVCRYMYGGCTSLVRAPVIHFAPRGDRACQYMFDGCSSLKRVAVEFSAWPTSEDGSSVIANWLRGVAASGTFVCPATLATETRSASRVPSGWTVVNF